jgi:membrane protein DedA with SNARE-associated domain
MIIDFLKRHIYLFLFFLTITEGPITSFTSAGFASQWLLNIRYVAIIAFFGDLIWDIVLYFIWRSYHKIKILKRFKLFSKEKEYLNKILNKSPFFYFLIVKTTPYLSAPSLIFTWIKKFKFWYFLVYSFLISIIVKILYLSVGYLGAISINELTSFLNWWKKIMIYVISWIILFLLIKRFYSYLPKLIKKESKERKKERKKINKSRTNHIISTIIFLQTILKNQKKGSSHVFH